MLVREIMTKKVVTIDSNCTVFNAVEKYFNKKIGCLVVTNKTRCVGIFTERDLIERVIYLRKDPLKTKIGDIMSSDVKTIKPLNTLEDALKVMKKYRIKKLPVISDDNIVGIITITDIAYARPDLTNRFIESWIKPRWID